MLSDVITEIFLIEHDTVAELHDLNLLSAYPGVECCLAYVEDIGSLVYVEELLQRSNVCIG